MTGTNSEGNARSRQRRSADELSPEMLAFVTVHDRAFILERWEHREERLDEIERGVSIAEGSR